MLWLIAACLAQPASSPAGLFPTARSTSPSTLPFPTPIQHVVILFEENHSFDNVLGALCVQDARCDGTTTGKVDAQTIDLPPATDVVAESAHTGKAQRTAIDGGLMDRFYQLNNCSQAGGYRCYQQFQPAQIPNLAALARAYVISDRTFELDTINTWGAHLELVTGTLDDFAAQGNPKTGTSGQKGTKGWGCDSFTDNTWIDPVTKAAQTVPSCIPKPDGTGPYKPSPVQWVPTIMDRLDGAGLSWRIYSSYYSGAICPTFAECIYGPQTANQRTAEQFATDLNAGFMPAVSFIIPKITNSQHNSNSMIQGDNWIGSTITAIQSSPFWASTAVFITYDDCGCFYDHVAPPPDLGIRVPMIIVSPYAKAGHTDSTVASFASWLSFVEHNFGLAPLNSEDANAYDYADSFDFTQQPLGPVPLTSTSVPRWERLWIKGHPTTAST